MKGTIPWWTGARERATRRLAKSALGLQRLRPGMTPLTSLRSVLFLVAVKGSLRRASTPLTEDFQVTNRSSHSIDIKRGKRICRDNGLFDK